MHPVIASVKDEQDVAAVLSSECPLVFVLFGTLNTIPAIVRRLTENGRRVFVNVDMIEGFGQKPVVIDFLLQHCSPDGILSSKSMMVKYAKSVGLFGVQRIFLVDSFSYSSLIKQSAISGADAIEILPGCIPRVITWVRADIDLPIIAGGLVCDKQDVLSALAAGAMAIASSNHGVWEM